MSRRSRPLWVYVTLVCLLGVLVLTLWLAGDDPAGVEKTHMAPQVKAPAVVFEEAVHEPETVPPQDEEPARPQLPERHRGIALILDDVGYDLPALRRAIALNIPLAIAILPQSPHAAEAAELAHKAGYTVMLHMPMEPANPHYSRQMDKSFIRVGMSREEVRRLMHDALMRVPFVEGVNNHMGSRLTAMQQPMRWVMEVCREQKLFFVDSRTNKDSVAAGTAEQAGLRWGQRQVFLDDSVEPALLLTSWKQARSRLSRNGSVIVIGHPHRETLAFLEHEINDADRAAMVPLISLLSPKQPGSGKPDGG